MFRQPVSKRVVASTLRVVGGAPQRIDPLSHGLHVIRHSLKASHILGTTAYPAIKKMRCCQEESADNLQTKCRHFADSIAVILLTICCRFAAKMQQGCRSSRPFHPRPFSSRRAAIDHHTLFRTCSFVSALRKSCGSLVNKFSQQSLRHR
jgi:hypothetical protein